MPCSDQDEKGERDGRIDIIDGITVTVGGWGQWHWNIDMPLAGGVGLGPSLEARL